MISGHETGGARTGCAAADLVQGHGQVTEMTLNLCRMTAKSSSSWNTLATRSQAADPEGQATAPEGLC
ncbi:hypothetical protein J6590_052640 [Homalodisca vitripennis]|nr:hypothetical protein J6590_092208 [Homalodisca vitripennis]KAG8310990.1 hypothetical protein J6590_052640 [Homalodisca vitripennis]